MRKAPRLVDDALGALVRDQLVRASLPLSGLMAFFAVADRFTNPGEPGVMAFDAAAAALLLGAWAALRVDGPLARRPNAVAAAVAAFLAADALHDTWLLGQPVQASYLMLVVIGTGALVLSRAALLLVLALAFAGYVTVSQGRAGPEWTLYGLSLFASCVLAALIHEVRLVTYTRLEAALAGARESEERWRLLVEQAPDAILVLIEDRVAYANAAALRLFGAGPGQLDGRASADLVHPDDAEAVRRRHAAIVEEGRSTPALEVRLRRLDGALVEAEVRGQPVTFGGRPADQSIVRDVTDRRRAEAERLEAAQRVAEVERLREMDRVKTQFVNAISHELRTPLTPVRVQLHLLRRQDVPPERREKALDMLDRNFARLASLVDDLLEVARIQAGTLRLVHEHLDLALVARRAAEGFEEVARQARVELTVVAPASAPMVGDARRLAQVLDNLLGNAFKFTPAGGRVLVRVGTDGREAVVHVADDGAGIAPGKLGRLFEPFSQVHDTMQSTQAGTGLGLFICRGIVEGHGGRIWAESDGPGKGSRFSFAVPLQPAA